MKKVLKVSAYWSQPSNALKTIYHEVKLELESPDLVFESVVDEVDEELFNEVCTKYEIRSLPMTFILDENDEVLAELSGSVPKEKYKEFIIKNI